MFKRSSRAVKRKECGRRSQQKAKAYSKQCSISSSRKDDRHGQKSAGRSRKKAKKRKKKKKGVLESALERKEGTHMCVTWPPGITRLSQRMDLRVLGQCSCNPWALAVIEINDYAKPHT